MHKEGTATARALDRDLTGSLASALRETLLTTDAPAEAAPADFAGPSNTGDAPSPAAPPYSDDRRAIASALVLCGFLWLLKVVLIIWYIVVRQINPLADASPAGIALLGGADFFVCACVAVLYRAVHPLTRPLSPRAVRITRNLAIVALHAAIVSFSVVSFLVTRIYGWPLDVGHLRSADDPKIISGSVAANAELLPLLLLLVGLLSLPLLGPALSRAIARLRWSPRQLWVTYGAAAALLCAGWVGTLRGIDTYGVKYNALVYFITHYKPPLQPLDLETLLPSLDADLTGRSFADARSLHLAGATVQRDFAFTGNAAGYNVVLIQLESTSAAHLDEKTTPNLMRLAARGITFGNHATVFSETTRASYAIYFSDYLTDLGTSPRMLYQRPLPRTSLAGVLKDHGYDTAVFHSGFLSYADLGYLFEQSGFDTVVDARQLWKDGDLPWSWGVREEETVSGMNQWLARPRKGPFFLLYATEFPHHPYVCPIDDKPYPQTSWLNRYRNALHYADRNVGALLDHLQAIGQLDNTLVVVTGDHGETVSTYPVGHGLALTREEVFTPFIISNPKLFTPSAHSMLTTNHLDIAPTLLAALQLPAPQNWLGRNLFADEISARLLFVQAKLSQVHGVIDNGLIFVHERGRKRQRLYDFDAGGFELLAADDPRAELMSGYQEADALFDKWARWRHIARASGRNAD